MHAAYDRLWTGQRIPPLRPDAPRILLVDDDLPTQVIVSRLLTRLGLSVDTAADGMECLALLGREPFQAVLMDLRLPDLDGLELTRRIRSGRVAGVCHTIPVIALTACAMPMDRKNCRDAGMDGYVSKPFEVEDLVRALEDVLGPLSTAPDFDFRVV
jgi:CheY-like chemotaxis protein